MGYLPKVTQLVAEAALGLDHQTILPAEKVQGLGVGVDGEKV